MEPDEEKGLEVYLGAEFYPPALPEPSPEEHAAAVEEEEEKQPIVEGQPSLVEPEPKPKKKPARKKSASPRPRKAAAGGRGTRGRRKPIMHGPMGPYEV